MQQVSRVTDLMAAYKVNRNVNLRLNIYNLFDEEYFKYEDGPGVMATLGDRREAGLRLDYQF